MSDADQQLAQLIESQPPHRKRALVLLYGFDGGGKREARAVAELMNSTLTPDERAAYAEDRKVPRDSVRISADDVRAWEVDLIRLSFYPAAEPIEGGDEEFTEE